MSGDTHTQTQTHANSNTHMHKDVRAVVIHIINVKRSEFHIKMDTKINIMIELTLDINKRI